MATEGGQWWFLLLKGARGVATMDVAVGWATVTVPEMSGSIGVGDGEGGGEGGGEVVTSSQHHPSAHLHRN